MADITLWEPFAELGDLRQRLDRLFGDLAPSGRPRMPALDVIEKVLQVSVPLPKQAEKKAIEITPEAH